MISFRPITLDDKSLIEKYTFVAGIQNCDFAFTNIYCWQPIYHSEIAVVDGFMVIRFRIDGGTRMAYMQPLGIDRTDFSGIVQLLAADARLQGQPLRLVLDNSGLSSIQPRDFACDQNRDFEDYVYDAECLRQLRGSKYAQKRNHINRFNSEYDYRFEPLQPHHIPQCLAVEAEWRSRHSNSSALDIEAGVIRRAFENFDTLSLRGGVLYATDRVIAFTYGSQVTTDTFCTHIEKADTDYDGAFTVVNKLLAESLPEHIRFINREEDLGLEGLRRSKLSYHPAVMCRKYSALMLDERTRGIRSLWQRVFGDTPDFVDSFLARFYDPGLSLTRQIDGRVVGMTHIVPLTTSLGRTAYIYAVATAPEYRGRGIASSLLGEALDVARSRGFDAAALVPQEDSLKTFYNRAGFEDTRLELSFGARNTYSLSADCYLGQTSSFELGTGDPTTDRAMTKIL